MRVFKPTYRDRSGQKRELRKWWIELTDHLETIRRFPAFSDKALSEALGRQIERLVACRIAGQQPGPELSRWLEAVPNKLRMRLGSIGLLDRTRAAAGKPLLEHLADFEQSLLAKGSTARYARQTAGTVKRLFDLCRFSAWTDISASRLQTALADLRQGDKGLGAQTSNFYLKAAKQFARWMVQDRRASESPLQHLTGLNVRTDRRHDRRALEPEQVRRLLEAGRAAGERFGMGGYERALLYRLAVETGLRSGELRSLTIASFDINECTVTVAAAYSKRRRQDVLPLRPNTTAELRMLFESKLPTVQAFNMPKPSEIVQMFRADLKGAGIAYVDESGRYADFHSLRHTCGSWLAANGVHPSVAQRIMRHSDINLTMSRYTHLFAGQESEGVAKLPDLSLPSEQQKAAAIANGTDGRNLDTPGPQEKNLASHLAFQPAQQCNSVHRPIESTCTDEAKNGDSNVTERPGFEPGVGVYTLRRFRNPFFIYLMGLTMSSAKHQFGLPTIYP